MNIDLGGEWCFSGLVHERVGTTLTLIAPSVVDATIFGDVRMTFLRQHGEYVIVPYPRKRWRRLALRLAGWRPTMELRP